MFDLVTRRTTRLTRGRCIDTSPCYSPDGKYIVFNSDRGGTQQLYIMDSDGANIRRLSFSNGRYATPVWSPRGDWIAFTKFGSQGFYIGIIHPDGTGERMLTSGNLVEGPTWSPNGRVVMFSHQDYSRKEKIFSVDITGYNKHEIATPNNAIDPEWSGKRGLF
jgi:TolB protein